MLDFIKQKSIIVGGYNKIITFRAASHHPVAK